MTARDPLEAADPLDIAVNIYWTGAPTAWDPAPSVRSAARRNMSTAIAAYLRARAEQGDVPSPALLRLADELERHGRRAMLGTSPCARCGQPFKRGLDGKVIVCPDCLAALRA